ncbi:MAG: Crp/Fnr family transcriptional regulator [Myxococcota bacterium]
MPGEKAQDYRSLLAAGRWFSGLSTGVQDALLDAAVLERFAAGAVLFQRGDPPSGLCAVLEGALRVSSLSESGEESLLILLGAPAWFGEISALDRQPRTHDAAADVASVILRISQEALEEIGARQPELWRALGVLASHKLRLAFETMEDLAMLPLARRLARRLAMMAVGYGEQRGGSFRQLELSQDQLAQMLWTSRQSVNAILKDLEQRGFIRVSRGAIEILDYQSLERAYESL